MSIIGSSQRSENNVNINNIYISNVNTGKEFILFYTDNVATEQNESFIFDKLTITEDMFAESLIGSISFHDTTFILDQLNLSSFDEINFTLQDIVNHKYKILDVSVNSDMQNAAMHGPSGKVNHVTIRFASSQFLYRNIDTYFLENFIGKISSDGTSTPLPVPNGFDQSEYNIAETALQTKPGLVQYVYSLIKENVGTSSKLLEAHNTYNDVWIKHNNFLYPYFKDVSNLHVSKLLNYVCEYACYRDNKNAVNFFYWEDMDKWNFKCIEGLLGSEEIYVGDYNFNGLAAINEMYNDSVVSMEVISDISPNKLLYNGVLFGEYFRTIPDWKSVYRGFLDSAASLNKKQVKYDYKTDGASWKQINEYFPFTTDIIDRFGGTASTSLLDYSTNNIFDPNYGFYSNSYNAENQPWWNYYNFSAIGCFSGNRLGLVGSCGDTERKSNSPTKLDIDAKNIFLNGLSGSSQISRLEPEYWKSQFDFSELPGAFLKIIYEKIKWPLTKNRTVYAEQKQLKTQWGVYKNVICCDKSSQDISDFFALIYAADKIYGGDGNTFEGICGSDGVSFAPDSGGIYAYWWKEVELWPRAEIKEMMFSDKNNPSFEIIEFDERVGGGAFPFVFVSSPSMLSGGFGRLGGNTLGFTGSDNRAYNLNELLNSAIPVDFEDGDTTVEPDDSLKTIMMSPGVSNGLIPEETTNRKDITSYPKKYQMMPVGKYRVISKSCPDFSRSGLTTNITDNASSYYYGGRIVQMKTISSKTLNIMQGYTFDHGPFKKQRSNLFVFDVDNTHDGLCTGDCA